MDGFNFDSFKINMAEVNSAIKANLLAEQQQKNQQIFDQISKHNAKRDATIMAEQQRFSLLLCRLRRPVCLWCLFLLHIHGKDNKNK